MCESAYLALVIGSIEISDSNVYAFFTACRPESVESKTLYITAQSALVGLLCAPAARSIVQQQASLPTEVRVVRLPGRQEPECFRFLG